jgi:tyrosine-protein phosphatase SIW14
MPQINHRRIAATAFLAVVSLIAATPASWCQSDQQTKGLPNFGRVAENLYRGGQPTSDGFNSLRAMGVGIVVNYRENHAETMKEKQEVESRGMQYVGIPWSANEEPANAQIVQFLDLVRAHPNTKMFVHCQRGADRTGVMIASYRIAIEHKSAAEAIAEMHQYHYDWFWLPHLRRYIESLPELLRKDPQFASYRPQQSAVGR